uniref:Dimer_Tnp_hAT domain-containing protein n=1 Tax=Rhabditophanes sp. KR3021 TaxID=114890 RepID=A0AC35U9N6_9BILA
MKTPRNKQSFQHSSSNSGFRSHPRITTQLQLERQFDKYEEGLSHNNSRTNEVLLPKIRSVIRIGKNFRVEDRTEDGFFWCCNMCDFKTFSCVNNTLAFRTLNAHHQQCIDNQNLVNSLVHINAALNSPEIVSGHQFTRQENIAHALRNGNEPQVSPIVVNNICDVSNNASTVLNNNESNNGYPMSNNLSVASTNIDDEETHTMVSEKSLCSDLNPFSQEVANKLFTNLVSNNLNFTEFITNPVAKNFATYLNPNFKLPSQKTISEMQDKIYQEMLTSIKRQLVGKTFTVCLSKISTCSPEIVNVSLNYLENFQAKQICADLIQIDNKNTQSISKIIYNFIAEDSMIDIDYSIMCDDQKIVTKLISSPNVLKPAPLPNDIVECGGKRLLIKTNLLLSKLTKEIPELEYLVDKCHSAIVAFNTESKIKKILDSKYPTKVGVFDKKIPHNCVATMFILQIVYSEMSLLAEFEKDMKDDQRSFGFKDEEKQLFIGLIQIFDAFNFLSNRIKNKDNSISNLLRFIAATRKKMNEIDFNLETGIEMTEKIQEYSCVGGGLTSKRNKSTWSNGILFSSFNCNVKRCLAEILCSFVTELDSFYNYYLANKAIQVATFLDPRNYYKNFVEEKHWLLFEQSTLSKFPKKYNPNEHRKEEIADCLRFESYTLTSKNTEIELYKMKAISISNSTSLDHFWESNKVELPSLYAMAQKYISIPCNSCHFNSEYQLIRFNQCLKKMNVADAYLDDSTKRDLLITLNQQNV